MNNKKFYAVKRGLNTGIFNTWEECEKQVIGVEGALFKSFWTKKEAEDYLKHALFTNTFNQDDTYYLHIDGYYENNRYGWGLVIYKDNKLVDTFNGESISEDNTGLYEMAGQIQAAMKAIKWAVANNKKITICHTYIGLSEWVLGNWNANKRLVNKYIFLSEQHLDMINLKKVNKYNNGPIDLATKLAEQTLRL